MSIITSLKPSFDLPHIQNDHFINQLFYFYKSQLELQTSQMSFWLVRITALPLLRGGLPLDSCPNLQKKNGRIALLLAGEMAKLKFQRPLLDALLCLTMVLSVITKNSKSLLSRSITSDTSDICNIILPSQTLVRDICEVITYPPLYLGHPKLEWRCPQRQFWLVTVAVGDLYSLVLTSQNIILDIYKLRYRSI